MSFRRPINLGEAAERRLLVGEKQGIHTFSNGTEWEYWAGANCYSCKWWDRDTGGALCAFEGAAFLGIASPALAEMFGWRRHETYPDSWVKPDECPFFKDTDDDSPDPPFIDPTQLTFLAPDEWPTITETPAPTREPAHV